MTGFARTLHQALLGSARPARAPYCRLTLAGASFIRP
jgi:hypothetical protein